MVRVLLNVPKQVRKNEPFDVKLLISHPMESGQRRDAMGLAIPRDIINLLVCTLDGADVLRMNLFPAIAANPFLAFSVLAQPAAPPSMTFPHPHGVRPPHPPAGAALSVGGAPARTLRAVAGVVSARLRPGRPRGGPRRTADRTIWVRGSRRHRQSQPA